jgi:PhzF family phenazine biosynthesis protein
MKNRSLEYYVLDVFTNKSYRGNPLAVVFTEGDLDLNDYENMSREYGYSETSFVYYSEQQKALKIRSFTPTGVEVHGAGHNLLGAVCAALFKGIEIFKEQAENPFVIMKDMPIPLSIEVDSISQLPVVKMQQKPASIGSMVPADKIAKALGLSAGDLKAETLVPTIVQTEVAHIMVPVADLELLNSIKTDDKQLIDISRQYKFEGFYCFVFTSQTESHVVEARFFNPLIGIVEDAATGTAAGPLAGFLCRNNFIQSNKEYQILQGTKLNQPSLINIMVKEDSILVGGSSVITMEGKAYL